MDSELEKEVLVIIQEHMRHPETQAKVLYANSYQMVTGRKVNEENFRKYIRNPGGPGERGLTQSPSNFFGGLSLEFLRYFMDDLDLLFVAGSSNLNENFIEEFADKLEWSNLVVSQKLTEKFLTRNISRFIKDQHWVNLVYNYRSKITEEFYLKHKDLIPESLITDDYCYSRMFPTVTFEKHFKLREKYNGC